MLVNRLVVLSLVWLLTPGLTEAAENLWHFVATGHTAHAIEAGSDHEPADDEHGCSGTFHLCSCHHSPPTALPLISAVLPLSTVELSWAASELHHRNPYLPGLFRPPKA